MLPPVQGTRLQRRAALDGAVGLDAQGRAARPARGHVAPLHAAAQDRFVGAEVADVVARPERDARLVAAPFQPRQQREQLQQIFRLQQHLGHRRRRGPWRR